MTEFVVRINRSNGSIEVSGEDKMWVDEKLAQLEYVYKELPATTQTSSTPTQLSSSTPSMSAVKKGPSTSKATSVKKNSSGKRPEINEELKGKLTREVVAELNSFISERDKAYNSSLPAQAIIIAIFLEDKLTWKGVDKHDLFTVYRQLGAPSGNTDSQLRNAYSRNHYFSNIESGKYIPSASGDTFARHSSLND